MCNCSEVLYDLLRIFGLSSTRLSCHQDALVFAFVNKIPESFIGHCIDVRLRLLSTLTFIHVDVLVRVNWECAVRVDCDQKQARVCVYQVCLIPHVKIMNNRCLVKMRKFGHVVRFVEFSRIDLVYAVRVDFSLLRRMLAIAHSTLANQTYAAIIALHKNLVISQFFHNPALDKCCLWVL